MSKMRADKYIGFIGVDDSSNYLKTDIDELFFKLKCDKVNDNTKLKEFIIDRLRELHPVYISLGAIKFIIDFKEFKNARIDVFENGWINNIAEYCIGYSKCEIRWEELKNDYMKYEITIFKCRG